MQRAGEVFGGLHVPPRQNDADAVAAALVADGDTCAVLQRLRGPWAAVHWRAAARTLTFGRDVLGAGQCSLHSPAAHAVGCHHMICGRDHLAASDTMSFAADRQAKPAGA